MGSKSKLLNNLHKDFREDPYLNGVLGAAGKELDSQSIKTGEVEKELFFDTMSLLGIAVYEDQLDIKTTGNIEDRRSQIEGKWKTAGKCDLELLQKIANSWRNGEVEISFIDARIEVIFSSIVGVPNNIESLKLAIETAKPAHLPISYTFKYRTFGMVKALGQTTEYWRDKRYSWKDMREKEGIS